MSRHRPNRTVRTARVRRLESPTPLVRRAPMAKSKTQLPGARKSPPVEDTPKTETTKAPSPSQVEMKAMIGEAVNGVCLVHVATEILKVEHLKDTEVFGAAGAYLAAKFRADTQVPPTIPSETLPSTDHEHENGGEAG